MITRIIFIILLDRYNIGVVYVMYKLELTGFNWKGNNMITTFIKELQDLAAYKAAFIELSERVEDAHKNRKDISAVQITNLRLKKNLN